MTLWKRLLCLSTVALCMTFMASAQENAELTGTVKDPSGAVVPNAKITLTDASTAEVRAGTTNGAGMYDFPALHNGTYNLKVTATGFEAYAKTGIVMDVAATVREDVILALGASTTTVTVQANALHLQTETNDVSNLITSQQITELATNGRSITSLTTLGTGVSSNLPAFNGVAAQGSSSSVSFNGMRPGHNDFLIDGGEVYDRGSGGRLGVMPSPDALAEFQTLDSNYQPDYGIASGGTVTVVLKSGTQIVSWRAVGIQPQRRFRRGQLLLEAVANGHTGAAPEYFRGRHRGPGVYSRNLSEGEEQDLLLLDRGMAQADSGIESQLGQRGASV